jgi:hypothetical protein
VVLRKMFHIYASHKTFVLSSSADMKNYTQDIEAGVGCGGGDVVETLSLKISLMSMLNHM